VEVHIYIGFETWKVKCTQYGICSQAAFKNARAMFSSKLCGAGSCFWSGSKKFRAGENISREGCPHPDLTPLKVRGGRGDVEVIALIALFSNAQWGGIDLTFIGGFAD